MKKVPRISRRALLGGGAVLVGAGVLDSFLIEPSWLDVSYHRVHSTAVWPGIEGLRIAQLTDVHMGEIGKIQDAAIKAVQAIQPHIVVITGDMIDNEERLGVLAEMTTELGARGAQVFSTFGNWENWANISAEVLSNAYKRAGARLLVDENVVAQGIAIAGTNDGLTATINWKNTIADMKTTEPTVLLTHSPFVLDKTPAYMPRFDLALSGHTHGGQIVAPGWAPFCPAGSGRFVAGSYDTDAGAAYVSRGVGTTYVPARFLCRPELAIFEFGRA